MSGEASRLAAGVPEDLAERAGLWPLLHTGFDLVELSDSTGHPLTELAAVQWALFDALDLMWLWEAIGSLPRADRWQTQARSARARRGAVDARRAHRGVRDQLAADAASRDGGARLAGDERPGGGAGRGDAHRDPARRQLRPHLVVGGPAPAAQPQPRSRSDPVSARRAQVPDGTSACRVDAVGSVIGPCPAVAALSHRPVADGVLPRRRGAHRALQLGAGQAAGRPVPAAHRGHRRARHDEEWTRGIIDRARAGSASARRARRSRARTSRATSPPPTSPPRTGLFERGLAYYCDLTSEQIQQRSAASGRPGYDGYSRDRGLGPGPGRVLRFRTPDDGVTVVDDVIRGAGDLRQRGGRGLRPAAQRRHADVPARQRRRRPRDGRHERGARRRAPAQHPKQQLLWEALGAAPPVWAHVPVLVNESRKKLSKRRDKVALEQFRDEGYLADAMVNYLMTLGWAPKHTAKGERRPRSCRGTRSWRSSASRTSPTRRRYFDLKKLAAFNGEYIRKLPTDAFVAACEPFLPDALRPRPCSPAWRRWCRPGWSRSPMPRRWSTS